MNLIFYSFLILPLPRSLSYQVPSHRPDGRTLRYACWVMRNGAKRRRTLISDSDRARGQTPLPPPPMAPRYNIIYIAAAGCPVGRVLQSGGSGDGGR